MHLISLITTENQVRRNQGGVGIILLTSAQFAVQVDFSNNLFGPFEHYLDEVIRAFKDPKPFVLLLLVLQSFN